ncbi:MAG: hypothetical protein ACK40C_09485 [Novosphingobium meiothermophilum]
MTRITLTRAEIDAKFSAAVQRKAAAEAAFAESQTTIEKNRGKGPGATAAIQRAVDMQQRSKIDIAAADREISSLSTARKRAPFVHSPSLKPAASVARNDRAVAAAAPQRPAAMDSDVAEILSLARSVGLKGFADTGARQVSEGASSSSPEAVEIVALARSVGLKGFAEEARQESQGELAGQPDAAEIVDLARSAGLKGFA